MGLLISSVALFPIAEFRDLQIQQLVGFMFSFIWIVFFAQAEKDWLSSEMIELGLIIVGMAFSMLVYVFFFFPQLGMNLPLVNLLTANYGHNHAAIFFAVLLPMAVHFWQRYRSRWWSVLPVINTIGVICLSFGRVVTALALMGLLLSLWKLHFITKGIKSLVLVPLLLAVIVFWGGSFASSVGWLPKCWSERFSAQLCKSFRDEPRTAYWKEAIQGIRERPLGWGENGFSLVSKKYRSAIQEYSGYAHNELLHTGVESGLFGMFIMAVMLGMAAKFAFQEYRKADGQWWFAVGVFIFICDAFFDYNWSYTSIWLLFLLLFTSLVFAESSKQKTLVKARKLIKICSITILVFYGALVIYLGVRVTSQILWQLNQKNLSYQFYPFDHWHALQLLEKNEADTKNLKRMSSIFNNQEFYLEKQTKTASKNEDKVSAAQMLVQLDPINLGYWQTLIEVEGEAGDSQALINTFTELNQTFTDVRRQNLDPVQADILTRGMLQTTDKILKKEPKKVAELYKQIMIWQPWILNDGDIELFHHPEKYPTEVVVEVADMLAPPAPLWKSAEELSFFLVQEGAKLNKTQPELAKKYREKAIFLTPWNKNIQ